MNHANIPISGWRKCVHEAAAFESKGEYAVALILDSSGGLEWWLRNDPPILRIGTPMGNFGPDFLYFRRKNGQGYFGIIEVKGDIFWDGPGSEARVKSDTAGQWITELNALAKPGEPQWEFTTVLDTDAVTADSLEQLRNNGLLTKP